MWETTKSKLEVPQNAYRVYTHPPASLSRLAIPDRNQSDCRRRRGERDRERGARNEPTVAENLLRPKIFLAASKFSPTNPAALSPSSSASIAVIVSPQSAAAAWGRGKSKCFSAWVEWQQNSVTTTAMRASAKSVHVQTVTLSSSIAALMAAM